MRYPGVNHPLCRQAFWTAAKVQGSRSGPYGVAVAWQGEISPKKMGAEGLHGRFAFRFV